MAQYGIAAFSVAGVIYIVGLIIKNWQAPNKDKKDLSSVIENNTKAIIEMTGVIQNFQVTLARQEQKIDELLSRARK